METLSPELISALTNGIGALILGGLSTWITQLSKSRNINPRYMAFIVSIGLGSIYVAFEFLVTSSIKEQLILWLTSIYGVATGIYNLILKPQLDKREA